MLSRLYDERVFTGSHDVVFSESSAREAQRRVLGTAADGVKKQLTRRQRQQQLQNGGEQKHDDDDDSDGASADMSSNDYEDDDDDDEEEQLRNSRHPPSSRYHPQHPYNAQLLALAKNTNKKKPVDGKLVRNGGRKSGAIVYENHPMEFVFLPNGEIRPRDECPPGLALPPPATHEPIAASESRHRHLLEQNAFESSEGLQERQQPEALKTVKAETTTHRGAISATSTSAQHPSAKISLVEYTRKERVLQPPRAHSSSGSSESSAAEPLSPRYATTAAKRRNNNAEVSSANESSESESPDGSELSSDNGEEEKENARQQAVRATQKQRIEQKSAPKRAVPALNSNSVAAPATRNPSTNRKQNAEAPARKRKKQSEPLYAQPQGEEVEEQQQQQLGRRARVPSQLNVREIHQRAPLPSPSSASDDSRAAWSRRPKAVKYEDLHSQQQHSKPANADEGRPKKSTKMDVRDLLSENSRVKVLKAKPSREQSEKIELLEQELQKEKKRVLEKMTQLLEEQGKNQQLQHQVDVFQSQLASKEREAEVKVKEALQSKDASLGQVESQWKARVKALEGELHVKDAAVLRLQSETEQLENTVSKLKDRERQSSSQSHERESSANRQMEKIVAKLKKFRARVESWKANSKEAMEVCDKKSDMLSLVDSLWLDFPAFPFLDENKSSNGEKRDDRANENANMLLFLKKRLRLREDELRQTHVKYVELKELCARQCVREADLQNFINEHRLRGNLIIRKDGTAPAETANDARKNVQFQEQQQQQRSEAKKRTIVNRATNTAPTYYEEDESEEEGDRDFDAYEEDDGGRDAEDEEEQQEEYYVREPKVFVQVSRDGVYEHTPPRSSAVLRKLEEEQARSARKKREPQEVERIRLVPSPTLARRYERVPAPSEEYVIAPARRKVSSNASTPPRSTATRLSRPPSISAARASGLVRRKSAQVPSAARTNGTRTMSVSSRISRSASVPWV